MSDINTPGPDAPDLGAEAKRPPEDMSSYNIDLPPADDAEVPGVPEASDALGDSADEPGSNATGVGS